jgi:uncharacterized protein YkwD
LSKALAAAGIVSAGVVAFFFLSFSGFSPLKEYHPSPANELTFGLSLNATNIEYLSHDLVNKYRAEANLNPLEWDEELAKVARAHSKDMAERSYFAHEDPDGNDHVYRYQIHGYNCDNPSGENLFVMEKPVFSYTDERIAESGVVGWMNSEGHRQNILYPLYEKEGIGVFVRATDVHVTENFC